MSIELNYEGTSFSVNEYLKQCSYFIPNKLNTKTQKEYLLSAKVELKLIFSLHDCKDLNKWFPGIHNGEFRISNRLYAINQKDLLKNPNALTKWLYDKELNDLIVLSTLSEFAEVEFQMIRLYAIHNGIIDSKGKYDDIKAMYQLAHCLGINKDDAYSELSPPSGSPWTRSYLNNFNPREYGTYYHFSGDNGILLYSVEERHVANSDVIRIPISFWMKQGELTQMPFYVMPQGKHPLYNLNGIYTCYDSPIFLTEHLDVAEHNLKVAASSVVWSSWYGGIDTVEKVNWGPLRGRKVYYVLISDKNNIRKDACSTAFKVHSMLKRHGNIRFEIIDCRFNCEEDLLLPESTRRIEEYDFFELAKDTGIEIPKDFIDFKTRYRTDNESNVELRPKYIIEPIIKERNLVVLYAPSGIGKSWLSLSMGLAVANGVSVCEDWPVRTAPKTVLYISGEMDFEEINNRIVKLKRIYGNTSEMEQSRFIYRVVNLDLASSEGQKEVEKDIEYLAFKKSAKVSFLILDNLTTLVKNGDYKAGWDHFFSWLEKIKKQGITILLVHHSNKAGDILGTCGIKNKVDFLIHASDKDDVAEHINKIKKKNKFVKKRDDDDEEEDECGEGHVDGADAESEVRNYLVSRFGKEISMYITLQKTRSIPKNMALPFKLSLNPEASAPKWEIIHPDYIGLINPNEEVSDNQINKKTIKRHSSNDDDNDEDKDEDTWLPIKVKRLPRKPLFSWKAMNNYEKMQAILNCRKYGGMNSRMMAQYFGVSKRTIDSARSSNGIKERTLRELSKGNVEKTDAGDA